jgi:hypothetical protein
MKTLVQYFITIGLLVLALVIAWHIFSTPGQASGPVFPATINRDCAPWDGAAFTISIPTDSMSIVQVSIWQLPDMKRSSTFSFPDESGRVGYAALSTELGSPEQLTGRVFIRSVEQGLPVEGEFNLFTETGREFRGKFIANWKNLIAICG